MFKDNRFVGTVLTCILIAFLLSITIKRFFITKDPLTFFYIGVLLVVLTANILYYKCDV
ncbi:general stress protein CsbA [Clostridium acetobutylicum]|uniref:Uncharacterized protein n=1 Tax=Clostridium acetobutylicum (strain ATCC 824 / DSM 792 / JCM 1419 / IAM 19013 / LMG 5710 / NBRC 13948 / NRRL B-527 / VKM B-1787 / 2291 / W) TaxID=272562 RepID=Q97TG9_CLOAB|nr:MULTISPECIES: hypothetical protein [Clostridium]AAK76877.1 Hypothetical protein CA_P0132 [Clostridium acetobutylicum ATCC 824]ADZ22914.1 Conserved hypothetical protein [Clostridium acetobutylicum EA 2018]AEI34873.1 hypothetical protein SMB_P130 [Clostridium acetobutylicum DSM 1731]AWV82419.1 hypothetical protein DK921_20220 [Clostridium acetobutylicum]MBC2395737.1 hypothetical protein [Clostridium acetobutylicum]